MPIASILNVGQDVRLGLWKMESSDLVFYHSDEPINERFHSERRKMEFVCVRLLLREMFKHDCPEILYKESGMPLLSNEENISISHTKDYCAIIVSPTCRVGIDIEYRSDRVGRITHRFLRNDERADNNISQLLHWSAKETIYKLYSEDFLQYLEMKVDSFVVSNQGSMMVRNLKQNTEANVFYFVNDEYVLTYAFQ